MNRRKLPALLLTIFFMIGFLACSDRDEEIPGVGMRLLGQADESDTSLSGGASKTNEESTSFAPITTQITAMSGHEPKVITTIPSTTKTPTTLSAPTVTTTMPIIDTPDKPFYIATAINDVVEIYEKQSDSGATWLLSNPGPFSGERVLLIRNFDSDWLEVSVPIKKHGTFGWVKAESVSIEEHKAKVLIDLYNETIEAWLDGGLLFRERFIGGSEEHPIPPGDFYINEMRYESDQEEFQKLVGTTAFSTTLETTALGSPAVSIISHQVTEGSGELQTKGCIRVTEEALENIFSLPLGTPVQIVA